MNARIGWIGLGCMGEAMARRLVLAAPAASGWNRPSSKAAPQAVEGATIGARQLDLASLQAQ